ncbi:MAG: hypothetical protein ACLQGV_12455 [Bryobacteraceae bacterium]
MIRDSQETSPTYENFVAKCPGCEATNIFNRASDLHTFRPIAFRQVNCQRCSQPFNISGDLVGAAYKMFLFECPELIERKQYMQCVLTVAQAYELFFSHFLYVQLLYRVFAKEDDRDLRRLNRLVGLLYRRMERLAFEPMRRLVLRMIVDAVEPPSLDAAEKLILAVASEARAVRAVSLAEIEGVSDCRLRTLLVKLLHVDVNVLRNRIVHKDAYRPKEAEARHVHDEAREVLFGLTGRLRLGFNVEWYVNRPIDKSKP